MIRDGDILAVRSYRSIVGKFLRLFAPPYTHTATLVVIEGEPFASEMDGVKNVLVPLAQYAGVPYDVYPCPPGVDRYDLRRIVLHGLRSKVGYDWKDIWHLFRHLAFGAPLPAQDDARKVCSSLTGAELLLAGWKPVRALPSIPWPTALIESLCAVPVLRNDP